MVVHLIGSECKTISVNIDRVHSSQQKLCDAAVHVLDAHLSVGQQVCQILSLHILVVVQMLLDELHLPVNQPGS